MTSQPRSLGVLLLTGGALIACGGGFDDARRASAEAPPAPPVVEHAPSETPPQFEFDDPRPRVHNILQAEVLSTNLVDWLHGVGDKISIRDFDSLPVSLASGFLGQVPYDALVAESEQQPHGVRVWHLDPSGAPVVGGAEWLAGLRERLAPWRRIEQLHWSVGKAEFQVVDETRTWGAVELGLHLVGQTPGGGREALVASFRARVALEGGQWHLERLQLRDGELSTIDRTYFVGVSRSAGVYHEGIRYGQPGNDSDAWNGLACGDVDGDGHFDVFVPSSTRSFLYRNLGDGRFAEEAQARGLAGEVGGTGAVLFDFDLDGDQDLAVGHIGWRELDGSASGAPLRLYANDGQGRFADVSEALGPAVHEPQFSLVAFDADGDGWTDLFACGYGRMEAERNDSWIEASNGFRNVLLRNLGGRFADVTREAGLADHRWSYGAAACDYDRDGDQDLYVSNNFGSNRLWRNRGDGGFEEVAEALGVAEPGLSMGVAWADLSGDGRLDLFVTQPSSHAGHRVLERLEEEEVVGPLDLLQRMAAGNALFVNEGAAFREAAGPAGLGHAGWAWGSAITDFDLDGALDVFCVNGFVTGDLPQDT